MMDAILEAFRLLGLASWIGMGLAAAAIARWLVPGHDAPGCLVTSLVGVSGALLGGILATYLGFGGLSGFDARGLVISMLAAVLLLMLLRVMGRRRDERH